MANSKSTTTADGPGLALSVLYEANDLLNVLREHNGETAAEAGRGVSGRLAAQTTLTGEISRRLNAAIAQLDDAVPHPADAREAAKPANDDDTPRPGYDLLMDLQIQVGELQGVAELAGETLQDADDVLSMLARRAEAIVDQMNGLIPFVEGKAGNGTLPDQARELFLRLWRDVREMTPEQCAKELDGRHLFEVDRRLVESDNFTISQSVTSRGLRYEVAMARFRGKLLYGPDATDLGLD